MTSRLTKAHNTFEDGPAARCCRLVRVAVRNLASDRVNAKHGSKGLHPGRARNHYLIAPDHFPIWFRGRASALVRLSANRAGQQNGGNQNRCFHFFAPSLKKFSLFSIGR